MDSDNAVEEIQDDVSKISDCIVQLGLAFNTNKCQFEIISLTNIKSSSSITLNNRNLEQVKIYKYLGVDVDDKFTFSSH
jgi:hypothetical protein